MKPYKIKNTENHTINSVLVYPISRLVGVAGFEPATSCSQSRRDNRATLHPEILSISLRFDTCDLPAKDGTR